MRLLHAAAAACAVLAACAAIVAGGHVLSRSASGDAVAERLPERRDAASAEPLTAAIGKTGTAKPVQRSRTVDAETVAPPLPAGSELERIEPRAPLGDLALAVPPKPKRPDEWQGTKLSQPVAPKAGLIEAKGYSVAVSGIDIVGDDETCVYGGKSWACGVRARTAFRAFLRGRAVTCAVPPEGGRDVIAAQCRIGKQDVGKWLVLTGWARAAAGGPYVEFGKEAQSNKRGIFGPPPDLAGLPPAPAPMGGAPAAPPSILDQSGGPATPPVVQPAPSE